MSSRLKHAQRSHYSYENKDYVFRNFSMKAYRVSQQRQMKKARKENSFKKAIGKIVNHFKKPNKGDK